MPIISTFYGIIVYLFAYDNEKHHVPHIHVKYGEFMAVVDIVEGNILQGEFPRSKLKLLQAWIEIHRKELMDDWRLAVIGKKPFKIEPLR